jgi:hypothetical protein
MKSFSAIFLTKNPAQVAKKVVTKELKQCTFCLFPRNFNGALSKKYLDVDKILKKAMMGTDIHEERLVMQAFSKSGQNESHDGN